MNRAMLAPAAVLLMLVLAMLTVPVAAVHSPGHAPSSAGESEPFDALNALGLAAPDAPAFLAPEIAYAPNVTVRDPHTVIVRWAIANGYYLYRDKFRFEVADPAGVRLDAVALPTGTIKEDPYFGRQEVYYGAVEAVLALERASLAASTITLDLGFQGCADAGLCYPPMRSALSVDLPAARRLRLE